MGVPADRLVGLIPAAGRGVRAYPYTATIPKSMLEVDGVPLVRRNVELMRDQLGIHDVVVVVGYRGEVIREYLADGRALGVRISYVTNTRIELNLPYSVLLGGQELARRGLDAPVCMILADECYVGTNHRELLVHRHLAAPVTCAIIEDQLPKAVRKNYVATVRDGRIVALEEKPQRVDGAAMGTGTYVLAPAVFRLLEAAFGTDVARGPRDWTSWLGSLAAGGVEVLPFRLTGQYVNVNSRDDLSAANYLVRAATFATRRTTLVYLLDDTAAASTRPIPAFESEEAIDEIVVVARRSSPTLERVRGPKTRVVPAAEDAEPGELLRRGLDEARGDILVVCYSDDTFVPGDVSKLLVYLRDADMVVGTRTTRQMIEQGTNMRGVVRAAHVALAKLVEVCWWTFECRFTDVCCVYRALWRSTYVSIRDRMTSTGPEAFPEMVIEVLRARRRIIEIPVNYCNRDPEQDYVRSRYQSVGTFLRVARLIVSKRVRDSPLGRAAGWLRRTGRRTPPRDPVRDKLLERQWQDEVGHELLEQPFETPGSAAVSAWQFARVEAALAPVRDGVVLEIGCGRGHFLEHLRTAPGGGARTLVGLELSRAVQAVRARGIAALRGDGEVLPVRDASVAAVVYFGALHHIIDYPAAVREARRVLRPDGVLVICEPVSSRFSRLVHRVLDPIVFRSCVYESPIDIHYKHAFREENVIRVLEEGGMTARTSRSDFLAYPLTGCYAGSAVARSERAMRRLIALEERLAATPGLRRVGRWVSWRFTVVARKDAAAS